MGDWNSLRDNPISNTLLGKPPAQQPGVGNGDNVAPGDLVKDPTTGMYFDPKTGTTFTDPNGTNPVTDPNVAQQVATNFNTSRQFLTSLGQVQGHEQQLAGNLQGLLAGNVPSIAQSQVQQGMNGIAQQQMSNAAGVSGPGGPLAQLLAARNTANAQIQANAAGGIARATEQNQARGALAQLLSGMAGQDLGAATDYSQLAATGQAGQQGLNAATDKNNQDFNMKFVTGVAGAGAGAGGAPAAGGAGAGA